MASLIEKNIRELLGSIDNSLHIQEYVAKDGYLQKRDPRVKVLGAVVVVISISLTADLLNLLSLYACILLLGRMSAIPVRRLARVWVVLPFFSLFLALPLIFSFVTPGNAFISITNTLSITYEGIDIALRLLLRVAGSVTMMQILLLTTRWDLILNSLKILYVPSSIIFVLSLTYRYIHVLLKSALDMMIAKKSRSVGQSTKKNERAWIGSITGTLMSKTIALSSDVHDAMISRGFTGSVRTYSNQLFQVQDAFLLTGISVACFLSIFYGHL